MASERRRHLLDGIAKIEKTGAADTERLGAGLERSGRAARQRLGPETGRSKGFEPPPTAFLGYLVAHAAYHQGDIGVLLAQTGHPLDRKTDLGIREWGVR